MHIQETSIQGLLLLRPSLFRDRRGYFLESYREMWLEQAGLNVRFVQDNQSFSQKGVLRGLHMQLPPYEQDKLVGVMYGRVLDVVVDLRPNSPTFGRWEAFELDACQHHRLFVPRGLAHGFLALEDSVFFYKCSQYYHPESETGLLWNDPSLAIMWGIEEPIVSEKDLQLPSFELFVSQVLPKLRLHYPSNT